MFSVRWKSCGIAKNRVLIFQPRVLDMCVCAYAQNSTGEMAYSILGLRNSTDHKRRLLCSVLCSTRGLFNVKLTSNSYLFIFLCLLRFLRT